MAAVQRVNTNVDRNDSGTSNSANNMDDLHEPNERRNARFNFDSNTSDVAATAIINHERNDGDTSTPFNNLNDYRETNERRNAGLIFGSKTNDVAATATINHERNDHETLSPFNKSNDFRETNERRKPQHTAFYFILQKNNDEKFCNFLSLFKFENE